MEQLGNCVHQMHIWPQYHKYVSENLVHCRHVVKHAVRAIRLCVRKSIVTATLPSGSPNLISLREHLDFLHEANLHQAISRHLQIRHLIPRILAHEEE